LHQRTLETSNLFYSAVAHGFAASPVSEAPGIQF
jgi:hypothetical protein